MKDLQYKLTKKERRLLRREERQSTEAQTQKATRLRKWTLWGSVGAIVIVICLIVLSSPSRPPPVLQNYTQSPNASTKAGDNDLIQSRRSHATLNLDGQTTWQPNASNLPGLMQAFGLAPADPSLLHHHDHLDIVINGETVPVPAQIGLSNEAEVPMHTHDSTGIIHVEASDVTFKPTLGLFFDVWGVSFTEQNIGGYVADKTHGLSVYVNGKRHEGDPRRIPLNQHDDILIIYGADGPHPMPASFDFPQGF